MTKNKIISILLLTMLLIEVVFVASAAAKDSQEVPLEGEVRE